MDRIYKIATRSSELALRQTSIFTEALKARYPDVEYELIEVTTSGDSDKRTKLWELKNSGFFTSQLEDMIACGEADIAVHSFKDLPTADRDNLHVAAVMKRDFAEDCVIAKEKICSLDELPANARVGTCSLRRAVQLKNLRSDLTIVAVRGNVLTRIRQVEKGECDAVILARAGIERLGLADRISFSFDPVKFISAPAQGALAIQARKNDSQVNGLLACLNEKELDNVTAAERQILIGLQCGCHAPVGCHAKVTAENIEIHAFLAEPDGSVIIKKEVKGSVNDAVKLADRLAVEILEAGGREILEKLK